MVVGGLVLSVWGGFKRRVVTLLLGIIGMGIGTLIVGLSPVGAFGMALIGMFVVGFMNPIVNGPFMAVMQSSVAPEMQGRVFSLIQSASLAMMPLSLLIAGRSRTSWGCASGTWPAACSASSSGWSLSPSLPSCRWKKTATQRSR